MRTKQLLLAAVGVLSISAAAFAQTYPKAVSDAGITVAPFPFKQTDAITMTVDVSKIYPRTGDATLKSATQLFIHSGVNAGKAGDNTTQWKSVVGNWRDYPSASQFTRTGTTSVYTLKMTPTSYYKLSGDPPAADAVFSEICCVFNDGGNGKGEGGTQDATDATKKSDVFIPVGITSTGTAPTYPKAASDAGITVAPFPFKQTDAITMTVDVSKIYPRTGDATLKSATQLFIHSGVNAGKAGDNTTRWKSVVGNWRDYPSASQFTRTGTTSVYTLKMTPTSYYKLSGDPPAADATLSEICCVYNDGGNGKGEGGTQDATDATKKSDVFIPIGLTITSVQNRDVFTAAYSYPNPFTEYVSIGFGLKTSGNVTLKIFDVRGNEVKTLINNQVFGGNALHIFQWDATNNAGVKIGSGAYFYRLETAGVTETGSMSVIR